MPKTNRWKEIFGYAEKQKTRVRVGEKYEEMTGTQAYRFEELTQPKGPGSQPKASNSLRKKRYVLAEASDRLNVSEKHLMQKAVSRSVNLYVNVGGVKGQWRRGANDSGPMLSSLQTLTSGYLALSSRSCSELAKFGNISVSVLEFHRPSDPSAVDLDRETMAALSAWGDRDLYFCLREPLWIDRNKVVLLAPLPIFAE